MPATPAPAEDFETGDAPARRRRSAAGDGPLLRQQLVDTARVLIASEGPSAVTVRAVAARSGVAVGSVYLHFANRDALVYEAGYDLFRGWFDDADRRVKTMPDVMQRLQQRGEDYMQFALDHPDVFRLLLMGNAATVPDRFDGAEHITDTGLGGLLGDVEEAMRQGLIARDDPRVITALLWMGVHGTVTLLLALPTFPWPPTAYVRRRMLDFLEQAHIVDPAPRHSGRAAPGTR